jgi:hypothetical protein
VIIQSVCQSVMREHHPHRRYASFDDYGAARRFIGVQPSQLGLTAAAGKDIVCDELECRAGLRRMMLA